MNKSNPYRKHVHALFISIGIEILSITLFLGRIWPHKPQIASWIFIVFMILNAAFQITIMFLAYWNEVQKQQKSH